jgi:ribosome-associated protein
MKKTVIPKKVTKAKKAINADMAKLKLVISILNNHKGVEIRAFNTEKESGLWDHYVVTSGTSSVHTASLRDNLKKEMGEAGFSIIFEDRDPGTKWIAVDFGDILVHILDQDTRMYYALERMWDNNEEDISSLTV